MCVFALAVAAMSRFIHICRCRNGLGVAMMRIIRRCLRCNLNFTAWFVPVFGTTVHCRRFTGNGEQSEQQQGFQSVEHVKLRRVGIRTVVKWYGLTVDHASAGKVHKAR